MPTLEEFKEKLRRPLERELLTGCQNRVVSGGLEKLLENLGKPFPKVREILHGYDTLDVDTRAERLKAALELLRGQAVSSPARPVSSPTHTTVNQATVNQTTVKPAVKPVPSSTPFPSAKPPVSVNWTLDTETEKIPFGHGSTKKLHTLGLYKLRDVLHNYPRRHEDRRAQPSLEDVEDGEKVTVVGKIVAKKRHAPRPGMLVLEATLENNFGFRVKCSWFQQPWVERFLKEGSRLIVTGKVKRFGRSLQIGVEHFEEEGESSLDTGRIVSVYDGKDGISQTFLRQVMAKTLESTPISDYLPDILRKKHDLMPLEHALNAIHFPADEAQLTQAMNRLRFDEYLFLELRILLQGEDSVLLGKRFAAEEADMNAFEASLPFMFTGAQKRVVLEVARDMRSEQQMARLVQGDVGSGKTAVAACALYMAARDGYQGALMAPTEILARQHFQNLQHYLFPLGVKVSLLYGAMNVKDKRAALEGIRTGEIQVAVGTQALIQEGVEFNNLGLAVIDEEHRFGVQQRRALLKSRPDVLVMSATPIPRSLALTAYGDLELSIIDEMPPGRTPIETKLLYDTHRQQAYGFAMAQIRAGSQVYVVTAMIEESETLLEIQAATQLFEDLKAILPEARIALLHGKMKPQDKDDTMRRFKAHEFDLLVSTTVIEVGVDVPNATVMVIENAERFGLAQLHQLRGRVGRGTAQSYCILVAGDTTQKTKKRLKVIEGSTDGFAIAEADLKLRGPGEIRGTRQSGVPDLKLGDLANDVDIIEETRELAKSILKADRALERPQNAFLKAELQARSSVVAVREVI